MRSVQIAQKGLIDSVKDEYFYEPLHKEIFKACKYFLEQGNVADPITLKGYLKDTNDTRNANIEEYLLNLQGGVLSISKESISNYAEEIKNCYLRRALIRISNDLITKSLNCSPGFCNFGRTPEKSGSMSSNFRKGKYSLQHS